MAEPVSALLRHSENLNLGDDDHTQYLLLANRAGGQLLGSTGAGRILSIEDSGNVERVRFEEGGDALLKLISTEQGFGLMSMTEAQRDLIGTPSTGLLVFNADTGQTNQWNGAAWTVPGGGLTTLQGAYDNDPAGAQILLDAVPNPFTLQAAVSGNVFACKNIGGGTELFAINANPLAATATINAQPNTTALDVAASTASAGDSFGIRFASAMSADFGSFRAFQDNSFITATSFSFSLFEAAPVFTPASTGGGVFSFLTGMIFNPVISAGLGTLRNLTGFFYYPTRNTGIILTSYGVYIDHNTANATTQVGGHFAGTTGAVQVGTGSISAPTVNGRWFQDGDIVLGASAMSGTERLRVVGNSLLGGAVQITGDINHDGNNVGFYATAPVTQDADIVALTDSSGGTANNTVAAVSGSGDDATINDNFADLAAKFNGLRTHLRRVGLMA